jgi:putative tricarboxylic transport membrane protein
MQQSQGYFMETLLTGTIGLLGDPYSLLILAFGVLFGQIFGAIPGLTAALGVSLLLPFTFAMTPVQGIAMLIGIYVGGISGGLYAATLLNIPGTPSSLVTCFDGYPMAKKGQGGLALSLGIFSSFVGGIISLFALVLIAPQLAKIGLMFGPWEYFSMGVMGLGVVVSLCSKDIVKGLIAAIIGMLLGMVGMDPVMGVNRFTFGAWQLSSGLPSLATLMGFFALCEIMTQLRSVGMKTEIIAVSKVPLFPPLKMILRNIKGFSLSSFIGVIIGILPGVGQVTASLLSYNQLRQISKTPEKFGTGHEEGVVASETANNAVCGGALIPMSTLGIPGDLVTSILLGGLIIHGLQPGPLLFKTNTDIIGSIFGGYLISNLISFLMALFLVRIFIKLLKVPMHYLFPVILVMCVIGAFTINNRMFDVWVLVGTGIVGYLLTQNGFSLPPIILGYILGPIIESNYRTAILASRGNFLDVFTRPISVFLLILGLLFLLWPFINILRGKKADAGARGF